MLHPLVSAIAFWYVCMSAADALRFCCADSGRVPLVFAVLQRARPAFCVLAIRWRCMQKKRIMCSAEKRTIFSKGVHAPRHSQLSRVAKHCRETTCVGNAKTHLSLSPFRHAAHNRNRDLACPAWFWFHVYFLVYFFCYFSIFPQHIRRAFI